MRRRPLYQVPRLPSPLFTYLAPELLERRPATLADFPPDNRFLTQPVTEEDKLAYLEAFPEATATLPHPLFEAITGSVTGFYYRTKETSPDGEPYYRNSTITIDYRPHFSISYGRQWMSYSSDDLLAFRYDPIENFDLLSQYRIYSSLFESVSNTGPNTGPNTDVRFNYAKKRVLDGLRELYQDYQYFLRKGSFIGIVGMNAYLTINAYILELEPEPSVNQTFKIYGPAMSQAERDKFRIMKEENERLYREIVRKILSL
jgi:hypothetical protein